MTIKQLFNCFYPSICAACLAPTHNTILCESCLSYVELEDIVVGNTARIFKESRVISILLERAKKSTFILEVLAPFFVVKLIQLNWPWPRKIRVEKRSFLHADYRYNRELAHYVKKQFATYRTDLFIDLFVSYYASEKAPDHMYVLSIC